MPASPSKVSRSSSGAEIKNANGFSSITGLGDLNTGSRNGGHECRLLWCRIRTRLEVRGLDMTSENNCKMHAHKGNMQMLEEIEVWKPHSKQAALSHVNSKTTVRTEMVKTLKGCNPLATAVIREYKRNILISLSRLHDSKSLICARYRYCCASQMPCVTVPVRHPGQLTDC